MIARPLPTFVLALALLACDPGTSTPPDAFVPRDAATTPDAFAPIDAAHTPDAFVSPDVGSDAFVAPDAPVPSHAILVIGSLQSAGFPANMFAARLAAHGTVTTMADPTITASLLAPFDLVVVGHLARAQTISEGASLIAWMTTGGSVLVLGGYVGDATEIANLDSLLSRFSLQVSTTHALVSETPMFSFDAVSRGTLTAAPAMSGGEVFSDATCTGCAPEASIADTSVVAVRYQIATTGGGRAFVWLDDHATLDVDWSAGHQTFWDNVLAYLRP